MRYLKPPAHSLWAVLIARIHEAFPLLSSICGGQMRIIAFITFSAAVRHIPEHIGVPAESPRIASALGPPLWDEAYAQVGDGVQPLPDWGEGCQATPDFEADQRMRW